ncbi:amidohydrolase family protein [Metabacillus halosaccharovorans]|uniref:amidohydrolase family protein n=1 Tax=Metabacillus halosaccharovorans TaxID=930124 RepID=UPI00203FBF08|nr:amidohydrolase family protein [Metabacillus halosaccharovorans]MCM3440290.1 amidohydrolase family protein [Metabacillus halosaccharovorans]
MKIDAHHHFWLYNEKEFGWINDDMSELKRDFLPKSLKGLLKSIHFDGSIVVQARQSLEETRWLLELAQKYDFIKGIVGWVDLCSPDVKIQLNQFANNPYLKGVRHVIHDEANDQFMLSEEFQRGISVLKDFSLTYDLLLFPKHIPYALQLVEKFPEQLFVLDHIGKPDIKNKEISFWKENLTKLAEYKNVYVKVSGMVTEADWKNWRKEDFKAYLDIVFNAFGPERVMIGSDWPVCTVSESYESVMGIVLDYVKQYASSYESQILGENCSRFYSLK